MMEKELIMKIDTLRDNWVTVSIVEIEREEEEEVFFSKFKHVCSPEDLFDEVEEIVLELYPISDYSLILDGELIPQA